MKEINAEFDTLSAILSRREATQEKKEPQDTAEENEAFKAIIARLVNVNADIEIIGTWIWIHGGYEYRELLKSMMKFGIVSVGQQQQQLPTTIVCAYGQEVKYKGGPADAGPPREKSLGGVTMNGEDVRAMLKERRVFQWELAAQLGVSEFTLCRWLRGPLDSEKEQAILRAIERLERCERRSEGQG